MRCPSCGFVSFDTLVTCKRCGKEIPRQEASRRISAAPRAKIESVSPPTGETTRAPDPDRADEGAGPAGHEAPANSAAQTDALSLPRAGFWLRGAAFLVDVAAVALLATAAAVLVWMAVQAGGHFSSAPEASLESLESAATILLTTLLEACYFTLFVGLRGQTPGKTLLRLKIVRVTGEEVGYARALVRWIGQGMSFLVLGLGFLMIAFSREKQGLHDKIAGTYVVRLPS
jgi:uncharacterized RDD family membrane protein YckC